MKHEVDRRWSFHQSKDFLEVSTPEAEDVTVRIEEAATTGCEEKSDHVDDNKYIFQGWAQRAEEAVMQRWNGESSRSCRSVSKKISGKSRSDTKSNPSCHKPDSLLHKMMSDEIQWEKLQLSIKDLKCCTNLSLRQALPELLETRYHEMELLSELQLSPTYEVEMFD